MRALHEDKEKFLSWIHSPKHTATSLQRYKETHQHGGLKYCQFKQSPLLQSINTRRRLQAEVIQSIDGLKAELALRAV